MILGRVAGQVPSRQTPGGARKWPTDEPYSMVASKELGLCETMLGKKHPSTLTSMNNLAGVLGDQGNYEEVEEIYLYPISVHLMGVYLWACISRACVL
jgi:hypothetical protein